MHTIIQWNCRGFYPNFEDLLTLIRDFNPCCITLQETMSTIKPIKAPRNYHLYALNNARNTAGQGLAFLVRNDIPSSQLQINSNLQTIAITIHLHRTISVCNIYIPPRKEINPTQLKLLINQLHGLKFEQI